MCSIYRIQLGPQRMPQTVFSTRNLFICMRLEAVELIGREKVCDARQALFWDIEVYV